MYNYISTNYKTTGMKREPVMTLAELSRQTGKAYSTLRRKLEKTEPRIEVVMTVKGAKYYSRAKLLNWVDAT